MVKRKDDLIVFRIERKIKEEFTKINKERNIKNSAKIRGWIQDYIQSNKNEVKS
ncbi:hypothetical protein [Pallidibacillus pasinlerensis]|uniref:Ribbon-helix-helix protein CopG domain-containing protein n=1 Tax=Pallidibacillus pasinlerensis TaxID=2703818 RepID=A0ABX0A6M1_9BACI|nr:hypothetical protein [Pallidibacillus pasinlerensis]NCU19114.1 hypothetical protein [Pallidibacillus pasinlerensis]